MKYSPHSQPLIAMAVGRFATTTCQATLSSLAEEILVQIDAQLPNDRLSIYCRLTSLFGEPYYRAILVNSGELFERFCELTISDQDLMSLEASLRSAS